MLCCCAGDDANTNSVVIIAEPVLNDPRAEEEVPTGEDSLKQQVDAEQKRKAEEAAEAARKQRELEEEARRNREAEEEERRTIEALKAKQQQDEVDEARRQKEAAEAAEAAAAQAAAAREHTPDGLPLTFRDASGTKTYSVSFKTKPLGMDFTQNELPVKITKVFGAAKRLGVSEGSCLIDIAGTDVEKLGFADMLAVLKEKIAPLAADGLVVNFKDTDGQLRPIIFPTKPLGMDFTDKHPVRITNVKGAAMNLGVEVDWVLASVDGADVETMEFDDFMATIRAKIEVLPTKD